MRDPKFINQNDGSGDREEDEEDAEDLREYFFHFFSNKNFQNPFENSSVVQDSDVDPSTQSSLSFPSNISVLTSDWLIEQPDPCSVLMHGIAYNASNSTLWDNLTFSNGSWVQCSSSSTAIADSVTPLDLWQIVLFSTLAGCTSLITVVGNLIVLLSFIIERSIRQPTNYFIASLAVSDLIIGSISMPFYTLYLMAGQKWNLGPNLCDLWLSIDYTVCLASIYTVFCITIDRFCSVTIPAKYRDWRTERKVLIIIAITWIIPILVFFISIFGWQYFVGERTVEEGKCYVQYMDNPLFNCFLQIGYFWITLVIMFILYTGIYRVALRMAAKSEQKYKKMTSLVSVAGQTMTTIGMNIGHRASVNPVFSHQNQKREANCIQNSCLITVASVTSSSTTEEKKASAMSPSPDTLQVPSGNKDTHHLYPNAPAVRASETQLPSFVVVGEGINSFSNASSGFKCFSSDDPAGKDQSEFDAKMAAPPSIALIANNSSRDNKALNLGYDKQPNDGLLFSIDATTSTTTSTNCNVVDLNICTKHNVYEVPTNNSHNNENAKLLTDIAISLNNSISSTGGYVQPSSIRETPDEEEMDTRRLISNANQGSSATAEEKDDDDPFNFPSPQSYRKVFKNADSSVNLRGDNNARSSAPSQKSFEKPHKPSQPDSRCAMKHNPRFNKQSKSKETFEDANQKFFLNFRNREYFRQKRKHQLKSSSSCSSQQKQQGRFSALKRYFSETDAKRGQKNNSSKNTMPEKFVRSSSDNSRQQSRHNGRNVFNAASLRNFKPFCFSKKAEARVSKPTIIVNKRPDHSASRNKSENRAKKALRTITIILGAFVICWTPWHVLSMIIGFYSDQLPAMVNGLLYDISYWLCYLNSPINPFCYALANQQFKKAFARIMRFNWHRT